MKRILAALLALVATPALAQVNLSNLPPSTVVGRSAVSAGPAQALPFAVLQQQLAGNQSANTVYAGPTSGPVALPTFRSLVANDLPATAVSPGSYGGAARSVLFTVDQQGRLTAASNGNSFRSVLTADTTYFVNVSTSTSPCGAFTCQPGNDANAGTSATVPWKTIQHAIDVINTSVDMAGFKVVVQLADGTYPESLVLTGYAGRGRQQFLDGFKTPILAGHTGDHTKVIIAPTVAGYNGNVVWAEETAGLHWVFQNLSVKCNGVATFGFQIEAFAYVQFNGVDFPDSCSAHIVVGDGGLGEIGGNYTISAGGATHITLSNRGELAVLTNDIQTSTPLVVTLSGTPNFSAAFIALQNHSLANIAPGVTYSGAATGQRWTRDAFSVFVTGTGLDALFPGNASGKVTGTFFANQYLMFGAAGGTSALDFFSISASVNFNSANTDTSFTIPLPSGITRYRVHQIYISGASQTLTTATCGVFTAAAAGGTAIVTSGTAVTVNTASENTNNNIQSLTINNTTTQSFNITPLFFRVQTPQGAAATATVTIVYQPLS